MATIASVDHKSAAFRGDLLLAPFRAVGRFLVLLAEASPQMRALSRLNEQSDAQLAARGLTRDGEIRRIFGVAAAT